MKQADLMYFPGWTRKSMTFTIDDGNVPLDRKFLDIVAPAGFRGTFNLVSSNFSYLTPDGYRAMYRGYEIANHCKFHPFAFAADEKPENISPDPFSSSTADPAFLYRHPADPGLYYKHYERGWRVVATREAYERMEAAGRRELEAVFGEGSVRAYVWPYCRQKDPALFDYLCSRGYQSIRQTGARLDADGFNLPVDRNAWSYTATYETMLPYGERYCALPDDGQLKFFCFGVHSHDFENAGRWDVLEDFAALYGNRPEDFWYATVGDIFRYEDAVRSVRLTDTAVTNPTDVDLFIKVDGKRVTLRAGASYPL